jgi:uncharacterized membrane protein YhaH (DUF805 family)
MQTAPLAYTRRNILAASLFGVELFCFVAPIVLFMISEHQRKAAGGRSWEGEAGGLLIVFLLPLALYTLVFFVTAVYLARKRGSRPLPGWTVLLGLLPIIGLASLVVLNL